MATDTPPTNISARIVTTTMEARRIRIGRLRAFIT
jgi:hypothetical protein